MRCSSSSSKLTRQPSSPFSKPSTRSGRRPVSAASCTAASLTSSSLLPFRLVRLAIDNTPPVVKPYKQFVGARVVTLVADLSGVVRGVERGELGHDVRLVVELALGL